MKSWPRFSSPAFHQLALSGYIDCIQNPVMMVTIVVAVTVMYNEYQPGPYICMRDTMHKILHNLSEWFSSETSSIYLILLE